MESRMQLPKKLPPSLCHQHPCRFLEIFQFRRVYLRKTEVCNDDICETDGILMTEDFCESKYSCFYDADCMMQPKRLQNLVIFPESTTNACYVKNEHMQSCD